MQVAPVLIMDEASEQEREKRIRLEIEEQVRLELEEKFNKIRQEDKKNYEKILRESENRRIKAEKRADNAERMLKRLRIFMLKSLKYPAIYNEYVGNSEQSNFDNSFLPHISESKIISAWNALILELPEFGDGTDEKGHVHPLITKTLGKIISTFNLIKIKYHHEARLTSPNCYPDFSLTSSQISEPSWPDCLTFIECKSTNTSISEGGGQVINYMLNLIFPNIDLINIDNLSEITFSTFTNGRSIQFFVIKKLDNDELKQYHSAILNLFEAECNVDAPSDGFKLLCRFLCYLGGSHVPFDVIKIRGKRYKVIKTFQKTTDLIIGLINVIGEGRCVAKYAIGNNKSALFSIRKEAFMYEILKDSEVRTLRLSEISDSNHLIFKDIGLCDLKSWCNDLLFKRSDLVDNNERFEKFVCCFLKVFEEIKNLHDFGYTHSDIRPANVLILEGEGDNPCLIDFVTATKHGTFIDWLQGTLLFMAKAVLCAQKPYIFKRKYDMESLCYSLLDCADKHFSGTCLKPQTGDFFAFDNELVPDNEYEEFAILRENELSKLRPLQIQEEHSHFLDSRYVNLFFSLIDKLDSVQDDLTDQDYADLKNILESSIA